MTSETEWNISGKFLGLKITDRIVLSGNYEKVRPEDGSIIFYGYFIDEQIPGGMYMYYIPSQDKILITYNIHTDNEQAVFTFGSSFKEIEEVVTFEEWQGDPSVDSNVQLDNIIRSGMSWRASADTQYVDKYVAYLWHAGETGSPNGMHLTQVHVVSNKNSFKDAWNEHARPGYILDKPRVIRTWNRVSMDPYYHRINHTPVNGSTTFTIPIYIPRHGLHNVIFTTSTTSATPYTHSGTGYKNRIYWELYKLNGFTDKEVDYSEYLNHEGSGVTTEMFSAYRLTNQVARYVNGEGRLVYTVNCRDPYSWFIYTDTYTTNWMYTSYLNNTY